VTREVAMTKPRTLQTDRWGIVAVIVFWIVMLGIAVTGLYLYFTRP
jgi:hypothetical protein